MTWLTAEEASGARAAAIRAVRAGTRRLLPAGVETPVVGVRTVRTAVNAFLTEHTDLAASTIDGYRSAANSVIYHHRYGIADSDITELTAASLTAWRRNLNRARVSVSMQRLAWKTLSSALSWEVEGGTLPVNPCRSVVSRRTKLTRSNEDETSLALPTWEDIFTISQAIPNQADRLMMLLMAWSGPRFSEIAGVEPLNIIPPLGQMRLAKVWSKGSGREWQHEPLKSGLARNVPVPAGLMGVLSTHKANWQRPTGNRKPVLFHPTLTRDRGGIGVWTRHSWRSKVWLPAISSTGLDGYRTKDLRAFAASALVDAGATMLEARDLLGHSRVEVTERHYAKARQLIHADPARMAIRLNESLTYAERLDVLYAAWVSQFGDPFPETY